MKCGITKILRDSSNANLTINMIDRFYFQCRLCLLMYALEEETPEGVVVACPCGGECRPMGRVEPVNLGTSTRCACDDRCIMAHGPKCDCMCMGENHGVGLVTRHLGGRIEGLGRSQEAVERRDAYTAALEAAQERLRGIETLLDPYESERAVPEAFKPLWKKLILARSAFDKARESRYVDVRLSILNGIFPEERSGGDLILPGFCETCQDYRNGVPGDWCDICGESQLA